ncbi:MAG: hypothetical protein U0X40_07150 [Ferruginibacter sp.]
MKKFFITCLCLGMGLLSYAQQEIKAEDAAKHEGDSVKICTKIFGTRFLENSNRQPTFLNGGAKYPESPITFVIFGESRAAFKNKPEEFYQDKQVCVTGRIIMYKGKPEIILTSESQIVVN